ncbi:hypothetical protein ABVT39_023734 [Epinephelus coioides]
MLRSNRHWCVDSAPGQRDKVKGKEESDISTNSEELVASFVKVNHFIAYRDQWDHRTLAPSFGGTMQDGEPWRDTLHQPFGCE